MKNIARAIRYRLAYNAQVSSNKKGFLDLDDKKKADLEMDIEDFIFASSISPNNLPPVRLLGTSEINSLKEAIEDSCGTHSIKTFYKLFLFYFSNK